MSSSGPPFLRRKKTKPSPPPQPYVDDSADSYSSEQEEIPPPPPPKSEQHDEDTEESSDDDNAEEDQDPVPVTIPKQEPQTSAAALTVASPALDGVRQLQLVLGTPSGAASLAPPSNRIWPDPMQLLLLREMVGYSLNNGKCKVSLSYVSKFHSSLEGSPLHKFSVNQILEKLKRFKKKYDNLYGKGEGKRNGNPLNPELLKLSRKLWGGAEKGKGGKRKRVKVGVVENGGDGDGEEDVGNKSFKEKGVWENAMVRLMKEFVYEEDYARQKIASIDNSTRDWLEKRWLKRKGKLNIAIVNFDRAENACLNALLSP